jgi:pimeloyl-ACP methyl ester carboxylesterase
MPQPALVMIHGLLGSLSYFRPRDRLKNAEAHPVDLLGYGSRREVDPAGLSLSAQANHVAEYIETKTKGKIWLLVHSMGGAVATLLLDRHSPPVAGVINQEGNFTLKDAFLSGAIARKDPAAWADELRAMQQDPRAWLAKNGIGPTEERIEWAAHILHNQPASTVHAMSRSIVKETGDPAYLAAVKRRVDSGLAIHLIAGEHSAAGWDVPGFVRRAARSDLVMPGCGHFPMLEQPDAFCWAVDRILEQA